MSRSPCHLWLGEYKALNAVMSTALLSVLFIQCIMHKAKGQGPRVKNQVIFKGQESRTKWGLCIMADVSGALAWHHPFGEW